MNPNQHRRVQQSSRRDWLQHTGFGLGGLALATLFADEARGAEQPKARAKRVIHLFLEGGLSQMDTFDPKPELTKQNGKQIAFPDDAKKTQAAFGSPFKFNKHGKSGLEISELLPHLAKHADDLCVLRSMHTDDPAHDSSILMMNCGHARIARPSVGSWVGYGLGSENKNLPGFVVLCQQKVPIKGAENWQSAFLPGKFQGSSILTKDGAISRPMDDLRSPVASDAEQQLQLDLLKQMDKAHATSRSDARLEARIEGFELAARMQLEAEEAFDVSHEPKSVRDLYGNTSAGKQCLLARRLVERDVRFVQAYLGDWDHHSDLAEGLKRSTTQVDQAIAGLLADLKRLGLLKDTLVVIGSEFGRMPTVDNASAGNQAGRDHNHRGFTTVLAGGGVKGGITYGKTDDLGFGAIDKKVHVHDFHATLLHLLGLDHEKLTYRYAGRDFRLTDVSGTVVKEIVG
jgi:Protein of unknown function (DUF1501)